MLVQYTCVQYYYYYYYYYYIGQFVNKDSMKSMVHNPIGGICSKTDVCAFVP